jgi:hypothetical protein
LTKGSRCAFAWRKAVTIGSHKIKSYLLMHSLVGTHSACGIWKEEFMVDLHMKGQGRWQFHDMVQDIM